MHPDYRNVQVDIRGQQELERLWRQMEMGGSDDNPYRVMFKRWGKIYQSAMRRRFVRMSRGGWEALALSTIKRRRGGRGTKSGETRGVALTRLRRKQRALESKSRARMLTKRGIKGHSTAKFFGGSFAGSNKIDQMLDYLSTGQGVSILVDTGQLRDALSPNKSGSLMDDVPWGIDVGFSSSFHEKSEGVLSMEPVTFGDIAAFHHFGMGNNPERPILVDPDSTTQAQLDAAANRAQRAVARKLNALYGAMQKGPTNG